MPQSSLIDVLLIFNWVLGRLRRSVSAVGHISGDTVRHLANSAGREAWMPEER
jgi:hypothetical protein